MHVMIDLETMSTRPDASIVQVSALAFEAKSGGRVWDTSAFNRYVNLDSCIDIGLAVDHDTVRWWLTQSQDARRMIADGMEVSSHIGQVLRDFDKWPADRLGLSSGWESVQGVWAHPATFDLPILKMAYRRCPGLRMSQPWHRRAELDCRSIYSLLPDGRPPEVAPIGTAHDALSDCLYQVCQLQKALGQLGISK